MKVAGLQRQLWQDVYLAQLKLGESHAKAASQAALAVDTFKQSKKSRSGDARQFWISVYVFTVGLKKNNSNAAEVNAEKALEKYLDAKKSKVIN